MPTKDEVASELATGHFRVEPFLARVIRFIAENEDAADEPIKLLEVNDATVPSGSIDLFWFAPSKGVPYPVLIAEITPAEYERVANEELQLPTGWSWDRHHMFERPAA